MKALKVILGLVAVLILVYIAGPSADFDPIGSPVIQPLGISLDSLDQYVKSKERDLPLLKLGNESRIVWADSIRKTRYSLVYLHGFSAGPMESSPTPFELAKQLGYNLYLPLLPGHGLDDKESFAELQPVELVDAAKDAIAIGQLLGDDVIVMSCSTGSTLSIYLAAANKEMVDILVMYSPNIALADPTAKLITGPWGLQIVKSVIGDYMYPEDDEEGDALKYWTTTYRTEGLIALQDLIDQTMDEAVFEKITQPYFLGYYYKNAEEKDPTVSTDAMIWFDEHTSTPKNLKKVIPFANAGAHVIGNPLKSQASEAVLDSTLVFIKEIIDI